MSDNNWIKDKLEKIDSKLDRLDSRLDNVDVTLAKQSIILEDHTRRSLANEKAVEIAKDNADKSLEALKNEIKPIQRERYMVKGALKLGGALIASIGVLAGIVKWIGTTFHLF